jgi:hypothetical protein
MREALIEEMCSGSPFEQPVPTSKERCGQNVLDGDSFLGMEYHEVIRIGVLTEHIHFSETAMEGDSIPVCVNTQCTDSNTELQFLVVL